MTDLNPAATKRYETEAKHDAENRVDRRWNWTIRWVSLLIATVIGGSIYFITLGCQHQMTRDGRNAQLCIERGGSWIYDSCVVPRG